MQLVPIGRTIHQNIHCQTLKSPLHQLKANVKCKASVMPTSVVVLQPPQAVLRRTACAVDDAYCALREFIARNSVSAFDNDIVIVLKTGGCRLFCSAVGNRWFISLALISIVWYQVFEAKPVDCSHGNSCNRMFLECFCHEQGCVLDKPAVATGYPLSAHRSAPSTSLQPSSSGTPVLNPCVHKQSQNGRVMQWTKRKLAYFLARFRCRFRSKSQEISFVAKKLASISPLVSITSAPHQTVPQTPPISCSSLPTDES